MTINRLEHQLEFILEIDRLKTVLRRTVITDASRNENSAEHSWHLAVMAMLLAEHSVEPVDLTRVLKMVLIHDIVEVDAGDTFCYDAKGNEDKAEREQRAADRLFGLLPEDQRNEMQALWKEFEQRKSIDARFANALDRMQPMLLNLATSGHSWRIHNISHQQVVTRNHVMANGSKTLWSHMEQLLQRAVDDGILQDTPGEQQ